MSKLWLVPAILIGVTAGTYLMLRGQSASAPKAEPQTVSSPPEHTERPALAANAVRRAETDGPIESPSASDSSSHDIFKPVDDHVLRRLAPAIEARFERRGKPMGYVSHRVMEIDTDELERALRKSLQATLEGKDGLPVAVPVLADQTIGVVITQWSEGNFGVYVAWGRVPSSGRLSRFRFDSNRNVLGVVKTRDRSYLIEAAPLPPYYIIFELERVYAEM